MRILVVEDDELLIQILVDHLTAQRYAVDVATDGLMGLDYAQAATYDLIVLDVDLPKLDGIRLCQQLRQERNSSPILLLTAKGASSDKVRGLDAGADDYVVKPCTIEELTARIRALLRRQSSSTSPILTWGQLQLNPVSCEVSYQGELITLSPKEYGLLELLLRNPQRIFSSSSILEHLWGFEDTPGEETIRTHIKRLRRKLKASGVDEVVETVYGMGYRLKPPTPAIVESAVVPTAEDQARLAAMASWEKFRQPSLERLKVLEQAIVSLKTASLSKEGLQLAIGAAHKLAGSLGMFGFPEGSQLSREIEDYLSVTQNLDVAHLDALVRQLHTILNQSPSIARSSLPTEAPVAVDRSSAVDRSVAVDRSGNIGIPEKGFRLLLVDDDVALGQRLQYEGSRRGIEVLTAVDVATARDYLVLPLPDAILLDLALPYDPDEGLAFLEELTTRFPGLPILIYTGYDQFNNRLAVVRRGNYKFISKSTPIEQVLDVVQNMPQLPDVSDIKVMAVDDDPIVLELLQQVLPRWGIQPILVNQPQDIWRTLENTSPDLIILDVEMPEVNGIELCRIIRNDTVWNSLPILFLTGRRDSDTIVKLYSAGADDYVAKPFTEPELLTRIFNRLERSRLMQTLAETDQLTGVANRYRSNRELNRYLNLSRRYHQSFCIAVVDLDHFQSVKDRLGYEIGDLVLRRVSSLLRQKIRGEDIVVRWGGEEFLIGMYGIDKEQARIRLQQMLDLVQQENFDSILKEPLHITFSAGIAEFPTDAVDLPALYRAAEQAMYQAKAEGRNQIIIA